MSETQGPTAAEIEAMREAWFAVLDRIAALGRQRRLLREAQQATAVPSEVGNDG